MKLTDTSPAFRRVLIMGNGGAGKTWLARSLGEQLHHPVIHLDDMHWEPGNYGIARDRALRDAMVKAAADGEAWIMEGVYGQLVNLVLARVTTLVWIDLPDDECIANIKARGIQGGESRTQFEGLLKWVTEYRTRRNNWNSFDAHSRLFSGFPGPKSRLPSRNAVTVFRENPSAVLREKVDLIVEVVNVTTDEQWRAYHDIRRTILFEARGLTGYDANHPDDRMPGHFPLLLLLGSRAIGAARLDLMGDSKACVRTVAIRQDFQRKGYGRTLMTHLEAFASTRDVGKLVVNAARDAVGFYRALGWTVIDAARDNPVLTKVLGTDV